MKISNILFLTALIFTTVSCSNDVSKINSKLNKEIYDYEIPCNVTRFSITQKETGDFLTGFFDADKKVIKLEKGEIYSFVGGYSYISNGYRDNVAIDALGNEYFHFETEETSDSFYGYGFYSVYDSNRDCFKCLDIKEKEVPVASVGNGFVTTRARVETKNKYLIYDLRQKKILCDSDDDCSFDYAYGLKDGFVLVEKNGFYGLLDASGKSILPYEYKYITVDSFGNFLVSKTKSFPDGRQNSFFLINKDGENVYPEEISYGFTLSKNVIAVLKDNAWILYDTETKQNRKLNENYSLTTKGVPFAYGATDNGLVIFYDRSRNKYGLLTFDGKEMLGAVFDEIKGFPDNGYWRVCIDGRWLLYNKSEGLVAPEKYLDFSHVK